jgi:hypothetical protein
MIIGRVLRVLIGLVLAFLATGLSLVLFVDTPIELLDAGWEKATEVALLALAAATHNAISAAPFALLVAILGERKRFASLLFYGPLGAIAAIGFLVQYWAQEGDAASIANSYALLAFLVSGLAGGVVYWLVAGRLVARRDAEEGRGRGWPASPAADDAAASGTS